VIGARSLRGMRLVMYVGQPLLILLAYDVAVMLAYQLLHWRWLAVPDLPVALYGSAIGVILGFRNNSCYSRWWEGRMLWGAIVNNSRSWARQVTTVIRPVAEAEAGEVKTMQQRMVNHQIAFVHALRQHLRRLAPWEELRPFLSEADLDALRSQQNVPLALLQQMGMMLRECQSKGWIDLAQWRAMDGTLDDLTDAQGGTERIKVTPMPKQYDYFPQLFVHIYCLVLPLAMVSSLLWLTPLGSTLVGFIFLALDKIGRDLENPFDNGVYDVPMTSICKTIELNLRQMLGETVVTAPEKLAEDVVW
jgi:ion channel-forming bestrophin family protein